MIIDKRDYYIKNITTYLKNHQFYQGLNVLVDALTEERDLNKLLTYVMVFVYLFNQAEQEKWILNLQTRRFKGSSAEKSTPVHSELNVKFQPPYKELYQLVPADEWRDLLHLVTDSITAYCQNDIDTSIVKMKEAAAKRDQEPLLHYYLAVYYSAKKQQNEFMKHYQRLSEASQEAGFSKKFGTYRPDFLHDPMKMIYEFSKQLQEQRERNEDMVKRYAHNWSNLLLPHTIQKVIKSLPTELQDEAMILKRAYRNETLLGLQSVMLQLRHSDDFHKVQTHVRKGIAKPGDDTAVGIYRIINDSLEIVLFKIFFSDERTRTKRDQRILDELEDAGIDMKSTVKHLGKLLIQDDVDLVQWVSSALFPIHVEINGLWEKLRLLKEEGGAYALLIEMFTELFRNLFTYGAKKKEGKVKVVLDSYKLDHTPFLSLSMENELPSHSIPSGTKEGLKSLTSLLEMVNRELHGKVYSQPFIEIKKEKRYEVRIWLKANLMTSWGDLKSYEKL